MKNNQELLNKITCTSLDKDIIVSYMKKYGACLIPNFISDEKCDFVKEECTNRAEVDKDMDFEDGSYRR